MKGTELISQWEKELNDWQLNRNEIIRTLKQNEEKKDLDKFIANFKSGNDNIDIIFISQFFHATVPPTPNDPQNEILESRVAHGRAPVICSSRAFILPLSYDNN